MTISSHPPILGKSQRVFDGMVTSSVLLTALGALLGVYVPFYSFMLCVILIRHFSRHTLLSDEHLPSLVATIFVAAALSFLCFRAGSHLKKARRWAAYVAVGWGILLIYFGIRIIIDLFRPYQPGGVQGEDFFEFLIAAPCVVIGVWWCVYLNLPHVRRRIQARENSRLIAGPST